MKTRTSSWTAIGLAAVVIVSLSEAALADSGSCDCADFRGLGDKLLTGEIYQKGSSLQKLLFRFRRTAVRAGNEILVTRTYTYADGRTAAIEKVTYRDQKLVSCSLIDKQANAYGRAVIEGDAQAGTGNISFTYVKDGETSTRVEALTGPTVVNDSMVPYLLKRSGELIRGEEVQVQYIVIARTRTVGFKLSKAGATTWQGKPAVIIKMIPSSFFARLVVDPIYLTVQKDGRQVAKYEGRVTPKVKENGEWKDLDAVMIFPSAPAS